MIYLRWLISTLLGLSAIICAVFLGLVSSTTGSVWLVERLIDASEQKIVVRGVSGRLIDHIKIDSLGLVLPDSGDQLTIERADLAWDPLSLFTGKIRVRGLSIDAVQYHAGALLTQHPVDTKQRVLPEINLPWPVYVDQAHIRFVEIKAAENTTVIRQVQLSGEFKNAQLTLRKASLELAEIEIVLDAGLAFTAPFSFNAQIGVKQKLLGVSTKIRIQGTPEAYQISGEGKSHGTVYPLTNVEYAGRGSMSGIDISNLRASGLDGTVTAKGRIHWQQALSIMLEIRGSGLNIDKLNSNMPGEIDFEGALSWQPQSFDLRLDATGTLLDYPLALSLHSSGKEDVFSVKQARFQSGPNHLQLSGEGGVKGLEQLKWQLYAPQLSALHQAFSGSVRGEGELHGEWEGLQGQASISGDELAFGEYKIETLKIDLEPLESGYDQFLLKLEAIDVRHQALHIEAIEIVSLGPMGSQSVDIELRADAENTLALHIQAQGKGEKWQLELSNSSLVLAQWPALNQPKVATIRLNTAGENIKAMLSPYCLSGPDEQICLEGELDALSLTSALTIKNLPVQRFRRWLQESEYTSARMSAEASLTLQNEQWKLLSRVGMDSENQLEIELGLQQSGPQLSGHVQARMAELQWLALLNDTMSHSSGRFEVDLDINGTLVRPKVAGQLRLSDAAVNLPGTGTSLKQITLIADVGADQRAQIRGDISSGEGTVSVSGDAKWWPQAQWNLDLALHGENFSLLNLPELSAIAAPDLSLNIAPKGLTMTGSLKLSQLSLALQGLSDQAVTVSKDARIVGAASDAERGAGGRTETTATTFPLSAKIDVLLGNDVRLEGSGLDVALGGHVIISARPEKPLQAHGKIDVLKGSYTAYGQNLSLQQSHLIFNGPPGEPGLDLKAERKIRAVTVGALVQGTLQNPRSSLYSDPEMPDSDRLAYLLTGSALSSAKGEDGALMLSALTELGVKGSAGLVEKIRSSTGLSTFELDTADGSSETALKLGRYLTPQLYVQYAKKIFSDSASIEARYEISDRLYIETQSGEDSSIDLKLQFER